MALLEELFEGSFRGAKFLVRSASTSGGRKQKKHEYPNSAKQSIEDLGFKPRNFKISAIVTGETVDDPRPYLEKKKELLEALEQSGNGTLSHPFFSGSFEVTARNYTIVEDITSLGVSTIDLEFDINDTETDPQPEETSISQISAEAQSVLDEVKKDISDNFNVSNGLNFSVADALLNGFVEFTDNTTSTFNRLEDQNNAYSALLADFATDITQLIQSPTDLADSFITIVDATMTDNSAVR